MVGGAEALYGEHRREVERYCSSMLRDPDDAADASQDVWMRVIAAGGGRAGGEDAYRAWLFTVARHVCIDRLRARQRASLAPLDESDLPAAPAPDVACESRAELRAVVSDVARLPERQRSAIVLHEIAGLDHGDIAAALGIDRARSRGLLSEAREALTESRAGRDLDCAVVRTRIARRRTGDRPTRAHIDSCASCQSLERRTRGHRLSSLAATPLALLRAGADRIAALGVAAGGPDAAAVAKAGVACALAAVVAGTVGAPPPHHRAPGSDGGAHGIAAAGAPARVTPLALPASGAAEPARSTRETPRRAKRPAKDAKRKRDTPAASARPTDSQQSDRKPARPKPGGGSGGGTSPQPAPQPSAPEPSAPEPTRSPSSGAGATSRPRIPASGVVTQTGATVGNAVGGVVDRVGSTVSGVVGGGAGATP